MINRYRIYKVIINDKCLDMSYIAFYYDIKERTYYSLQKKKENSYYIHYKSLDVITFKVKGVFIEYINNSIEEAITRFQNVEINNSFVNVFKTHNDMIINMKQLMRIEKINQINNG